MRNAADKEQVKRAARFERNHEARKLVSARVVLEGYDGRAFCWDLLARARVFESIWHPSAEIHYLAGRQDYGHELMALLIQADENLYQLMEREARERARRDDRTTDAGHTPAAADGGSSAGGSDIDG